SAGARGAQQREARRMRAALPRRRRRAGRQAEQPRGPLRDATEAAEIDGHPGRRWAIEARADRREQPGWRQPLEIEAREEPEPLARVGPKPLLPAGGATREDTA